MTIAQDIRAQAAGQLVELFELDATSLGGSLLRFHNGKNGIGGDVVWQGATYSAFPIEAEGFEYNAAGQMPRPKLRVANATGLLGALVRTYGDLIGAKLTRRRTMVKYLDAANFLFTWANMTDFWSAYVLVWPYYSGNPTADPTASLPDDVYFVDRKAIENKIVIEFELAAAFDVAGVQLPRRYIVQNVCPWRYRGAECGYTGPAVAKADDTPTAVLAQDVCGKRLSSCKLRFGAFGELPFGGYPAAGLVR